MQSYKKAFEGRVSWRFSWLRDTGLVWLRGLACRLFDSLLVSLNSQWASLVSIGCQARFFPKKGKFLNLPRSLVQTCFVIPRT